MSNENKYEKPPSTAPPPYSQIYPTGNAQPEAPQYGFQLPPQSQQPMYPQYFQSNPSGHPSQPQQGYIPPPQTTQPMPVNHQTVVVMGGCPSCRVGILEDNYTCCGILCAICFFPIGILCCLALKEKQCTNCKASF